MKLLTENEDPMAMKSRHEIEEPSLAKPYTLQELPIRTNERIDWQLPRWKKSNTDMQEP
jgi:hypothetical protein